MVMDKNQVIGMDRDDGTSDAIADDEDKYWLPGKLTHDLEDLWHPIEEHDWRAIYKANSRTPAELELVQSPAIVGLAYWPTNLTGFYRIMGSRSAGAGHDHDFSFISSGNLPTYTIRSESTDGDNDKFFSMVGCKAHMLSGFFDFSQGFNQLSFTEGLNGIGNVTPAFSTKHTSGPIHPTDDGLMSGTEVTNHFERDSNFAFHWDSAGGDDDYTDEIVRMLFTIMNYQKVWYINNSNVVNTIIHGVIVLAFSFELQRGAAPNIYSDFKAKTQHDMYLTIYAGSTNYMKLTWDDVGLRKCRANYPIRSGDDKMWYVEGIAEGLAVEGTDGLNTTEFYT